MALSSCAGVFLQGDIGQNFDDGNVLIEPFCLQVGLGGLTVEVGGGSFADEVAWLVTFPSGAVERGGAGSTQIGGCVAPTPQPSVTPMPTAPCELYTVELSDAFGDG